MKELEDLEKELEQLKSKYESEVECLKEELQREKDTNRHLEQRSGLLNLPPDFDVEASVQLVREKECELAAVLESKTQLQLTVDETNSTLRDRERFIKRQESEIEGLRVELRSLKGGKLAAAPLNKRIEIRLNEAMGEVQKYKKQLQAAEEVRK